MSHQPFSDETLAQIRAEIAAAEEAGEPHWLSGKSDAQIQALGWAGIQIGRLFRSKPAPAPEETVQRIDLAPGVTLVLDGAKVKGFTTATLPPGWYSVAVTCQMERIPSGGYAKAEAHFTVQVSAEDEQD